jgi:hypothetical protein
LITLRDAPQYIIKLPKAERELPQWETRDRVADTGPRDGGDPMVPHIATVKAPQQREPKAAPRRKPANAYEPLLISTEVGVSRDSTGKVCTDERNALAFPNLGLLPS